MDRGRGRGRFGAGGGDASPGLGRRSSSRCRRRGGTGKLARPRPDVRRTALLDADADQPRHGRRARPGVGQEPQHSPSLAGDALGDRRCHVLHGLVERRLRGGRQDRRGDLALRPRDEPPFRTLLVLRRTGEPGRGRVQRQALLRDVRRPACGRGPGHRREDLGSGHHPPPDQQSLHHHRCAAGGARQGVHRPEQLGVRASRAPLGLRCGHRRTRLAVLCRAGRSFQALRTSGTRGSRQDLVRRVVEARRRRHGLAFHRLRRQVRPTHLRYRQRRALAAQDPLARRRRQPVSGRRHVGQPHHRSHELVLPDDAGGQLGLQRLPGHRAARHGDRRQDPIRAVAGAEERLLLRPRPGERRVAAGQSLRTPQLGHAYRHGNGSPGGGSGNGLRREGAVGSTEQRRGPQLAGHGRRSRPRHRLPAGAGHAGLVWTAAIVPRHRRVRAQSPGHQPGRGHAPAGGRAAPAGVQRLPEGIRSVDRRGGVER